jgi:SAM-dependent methyltransferase
MFRHPVLSSSQYVELYRQGNPEQWTGDAEREDLRVIRSMILERPGPSRVLDVGCGAGDFLLSLPEKFQKFGIEPSDGAEHASGRGVKIIARQIRDLAADAEFNVVTIIDVIEHVVDPASLLADAYAHLAPGGKIIVSTGDPQNSMWRNVWKSKFWYVSFPEHITFPSALFCQNWCTQNNAVMGGKLTLRYRVLSRWRMAISFLTQAVFYFSPVVFSWIGRILARMGVMPTMERQFYSPGIPGLFLDHHIIVIEKPSA